MIDLFLYNPNPDWSISLLFGSLFLVTRLSISDHPKQTIFFSIVGTILLQYVPIIMCGSLILLIGLWMMWGQLTDYGNYGNTLHQQYNPSLYDDQERHKVSEIDVSGIVIAYRYFDRLPDGTLTSIGKGLTVDGGTYPGGFKRSDRVPTLRNTNGIYAAKTPDSPILDDFRGYGDVLAKVKLSGRIIEGEYGYRAQYCEVIKILEE